MPSWCTKISNISDLFISNLLPKVLIGLISFCYFIFHYLNLISVSITKDFLKKEWSSEECTSGSKYNESLAHLVK